MAEREKEQDEEDGDEIATGLSRRLRVLLCLMGCPTHSYVPLRSRSALLYR